MIKNKAGQTWLVFAFNRITNLPYLGTHLVITAKLKKDQGSYLGTSNPNPFPIGDGYFEFPLTQAETDADSHELIPAHSDPDFRVISARNITTDVLMVPFVQLLARSDLAIVTDRATELAVLNANEGSGSGSYDKGDSQENIRDTLILGQGGYPSDADVRLGVIFGPASELTGQCRVPPVERVESGFAYDDQDTLTGTLQTADVPAQDDVRSGVVYANATLTGTIVLPAESEVLLNVTYGAAGVELTGLLQVEADQTAQSIDLVFTQGDDVTLTIENPGMYDLASAQEITFTIASDRSPYGELLRVDGTDGGTGAVTVTLTPEQSDVASGTWRYDLRARLAGGEVRTINRGWCEIALAYSTPAAAV